MSTVAVQSADLEKVLDVVKIARNHHLHKDRMNATTHMTPMRPSPLTTSLGLAVDRLEALLAGLREHTEEIDDTTDEATPAKDEPAPEGLEPGA